MSTVPKHLWSWVSQPRVLNTIVAMAWFTVLSAGTVSWVNPPNIIQDGIGYILAKMMSGLFMLGGLLGLVGALTGIWFSWVERSGIYFAGAATGVYMWTLAAYSDFASPRFHFSLALAGMFVLVARILTIRYFLAHPYTGERLGDG